MKKTFTTILFISILKFTFAQTEQVSECLQLIKLSESVYIHTCENNNGIVYFDGNEAIVVSTPSSDIETINLLNWINEKATVVGWIIDRWHYDAMEGLDIVQQNEIPNYATKQTQIIAKEKGLPIPEVGFKRKLKLKVGDKKVICHYLGEAHTNDGIVVWIPSEKILFGGNEVRNLNGWVGNIGDANLSEWSKTITKVKKKYGDAKIVVPGHGKHGNAELIDYTIDLYSFPKNVINDYDFPPETLIVNDSIDGFQFFGASKKELEDATRYYDGKAMYHRQDQDVMIYADSFDYIDNKKMLFVPTGYLSLQNDDRTENFNFDKLYLILREDEIEMVLIIQSIDLSFDSDFD